MIAAGVLSQPWGLVFVVIGGIATLGGIYAVARSGFADATIKQQKANIEAYEDALKLRDDKIATLNTRISTLETELAEVRKQATSAWDVLHTLVEEGRQK